MVSENEADRAQGTLARIQGSYCTAKTASLCPLSLLLPSYFPKPASEKREILWIKFFFNNVESCRQNGEGKRASDIGGWSGASTSGSDVHTTTTTTTSQFFSGFASYRILRSGWPFLLGHPRTVQLAHCCIGWPFSLEAQWGTPGICLKSHVLQPMGLYQLSRFWNWYGQKHIPRENVTETL